MRPHIAQRRRPTLHRRIRPPASPAAARAPRAATRLPRRRAERGTRGAPSFDHLVGEREQPVRNLEAERLGGLEVDAQLDFRGLYHRQVGRLFTLEKATGVKSDLSVLPCQADPVTDEPSRDY